MNDVVLLGILHKYLDKYSKLEVKADDTFTNSIKEIDSELAATYTQYTKILSTIAANRAPGSEQVVQGLQEVVGAIYNARKAIGNLTAQRNAVNPADPGY